MKSNFDIFIDNVNKIKNKLNSDNCQNLRNQRHMYAALTVYKICVDKAINRLKHIDKDMNCLMLKFQRSSRRISFKTRFFKIITISNFYKLFKLLQFLIFC